MAIRKNTRRFDPRYFMDEKTDLNEEGRSEHDAEASGMVRSYEEGLAAGKAGDPPRLKGGEYMRGYKKGKEESKEKVNETEWVPASELEPRARSTAEPQELVQRIESAYHDLQDAFEELPDEMAQEMGREIVTRLETLMDTTEHPEDYRE